MLFQIRFYLKKLYLQICQIFKLLIFKIELEFIFGNTIKQIG